MEAATANLNPYLLVVNPETKVEYAVTEEGYAKAEMESGGYKVDRYQDGRSYEGSLPTLSAAERESLGLPPTAPPAPVAAATAAPAKAAPAPPAPAAPEAVA